MLKSGKIWGWTAPLLTISGVQIERIFVNKGGYCSVHMHEHRYNAFYVFDGQLEISIWKNDYDLCDKTILKQNDLAIVKPKEFHRFLAQADTNALEIYWTDPAVSEDIVRKLSGGITNSIPPDIGKIC